MAVNVLVCNGGSSTLKTTLYQLQDADSPIEPVRPLLRVAAAWGRQSGHAEIEIITARDEKHKTDIAIDGPESAVRPVLEAFWSGPDGVLKGPGDISVTGHRIVHGGPKFRTSVKVTPEVKAEIRRCGEFAPEHNPLEVDVIEAAETILGTDVPQIAVFDTTFHSTIPLQARVYPLPFELYKQGIARYGFHGISHDYVSRRAAQILGRELRELRMITCHLGNGASLCAIRDGKSIDTTMGFTPLEGLMMGTRSGSVDPGILVYLLRHYGYDADQLDHLLNKESGLKGLSGISGDMREVLKACEEHNERASLSFDVYLHHLCRETGVMLASLGGLDCLVFTAGIGENTPIVREVLCVRLEFAGVRLHAGRNRESKGDAVISSDDSRVKVLVIKTQEEWQIARECMRLRSPG